MSHNSQLSSTGACLISLAAVTGILISTTLAGRNASDAANQTPELIDISVEAPVPPALPAPKWEPLFDGKSLEGWETTKFGGEGEVEVKDGQIVMHLGGYMTGVTATRDIPKTNYEVDMLAQRVDGNDFFCGLTFPVKESHCSLILGGWGGGVCGLSSIDGMDASENETTHFRKFEKGEWYRVRVRVTPTRIRAWLDNERIVDQDIDERNVGIRPEVELSCPLGLSTWQTTGAVKDIRVRKLSPAEVAETEAVEE